MKMKFFRTILNKTEEDRITNTNIRLELGMDETENNIQKSWLTWIRHADKKRENT